MSANNQILVKEHKGKWYVFEVMAESWGETGNNLSLSEATSVHSTYEAALVAAHELNKSVWTEYGVHHVLAKDGADVTIVEGS